MVKKFLLLAILGGFFLLADYQNIFASNFYNISGGISKRINEWEECRKVDNPITNPAVFIPTKTSDEWQQFRLHYPTGVSLNACEWSLGYGYRKPITIQENSGSALANFATAVTVNTQTLISDGKMRSDCGDMRFSDSNGETPLSYWIETGCNTSATLVWVNIPSLPASSLKTIYMYYGNSAQTSQSNGSNVFPFFDDFESGNLNKWTLEGAGYGSFTAVTDQSFGGNYSAKGIDTSTSGYPIITASNPLSGSLVNEVRARFGNTLYHFPWSWVDQVGCNTNWLMAYESQKWQYTLDGCHSYTFPNSTSWTTNKWYKIKIAYISGSYVYRVWIDGIYLAQVSAKCGAICSGTSHTVTSLPKIRISPGKKSQNGGIMWVDDFFVRNYASVEPSASTGSEEIF